MSIVKRNNPKIIVVCGSTGSGKTGLAASLCKKFNGEIINADSRQVYREMDIGTAKGEIKNQKPKTKNLESALGRHTIKEVPIWLIDIVDPDERYSVGQFKIDAEKAIDDIVARGKVPFVVGGTGLYIDALVENFKLPMSNDEIESKNKSQKTKLQFNSKKLEELVKILEKLDSDALTIVDLKNRRRVERAIEVCLTTGIPFTKQRVKGERQYEVLKLAPKVSLDREKLYEKINERVEEMIGEGLEDEVRKLIKKYGWESEAMTGIGYREWRGYFENDKRQITNSKSQIANNIKGIIEKIKQDTRNYAKRQMTWFKRDKEINYVDLREAERLVLRFLNDSHP